MIRYATPEEMANWDQLVLANPDGGNVLQIKAFAETKAAFGWSPRYMIYEATGLKVATLFCVRTVPLLGELWYAPKGPGVITANQWRQVVVSNRKLKEPFIMKLEPELPKKTKLAGADVVKAAREIQYNYATVVVDLKLGEDDMLASFKQKTRYNIRLAEKKGVVVEPVETTPETMRELYELMQATQERAGFYLRSFEYFERFWRLHTESGNGQMFQARFEGKLLAAVFATYAGTKGLYKDGGSNREHPELQAAYLLQWRIMQWLKAYGVTEYDLHGTPPADQIDNPNHPLAGLARFKTGFSPTVVEYVGVYDQIIKRQQYQIWQKLGERLYNGYLRRVKHELFY